MPNPGREGFIRKTEAELASLRSSGKILSSALEAVQAAIAPGVTGCDLNALVTGVITAAGGYAELSGLRAL